MLLQLRVARNQWEKSSRKIGDGCGDCRVTGSWESPAPREHPSSWLLFASYANSKKKQHFGFIVAMGFTKFFIPDVFPEFRVKWKTRAKQRTRHTRSCPQIVSPPSLVPKPLFLSVFLSFSFVFQVCNLYFFGRGGGEGREGSQRKGKAKGWSFS